MTIYITKKDHHKNKFLLNWQNPDTSAMMEDWFPSLKELYEYVAAWPVREIVKVNF